MRKLKRTFYIGTTTFLLGLGIVFSNNVLAAVEQETTTQVETTTVEETTPNETTTPGTDNTRWNYETAGNNKCGKIHRV